MIIDACKPFAWREDFPTASALSIDEAKEIETKWHDALWGKART